ncbi:MAG: N-acetyltransferase family protein [Firmicutes bacterium]|nr:N-acetyltransferase family protein [Bacillota bacterium]
MIIRYAQEQDLPAIVDIYNSTIPSRVVTADTEPVSVESRISWFCEHTKANHPIWVAELDGVVIGWLSLQKFYDRPAYDGTAEISLYVSSDHREKGVGKLLFRKAINKCPELRLTNLLGFIFAHNAPSLQFFKRFGFKQWGYFPKVAVIDGTEEDLIILGLRVDII